MAKKISQESDSATPFLSGVGNAAEGDKVLMAISVSPHVYYFQGDAGMASSSNQGFMSNAGFVVTDDGVVVFDSLGTLFRCTSNVA